MADRLWRVQCTIPLTNNVPEDSVVNTWYFDDDDDPVAAPEDTAGWIINELTAFYQAIDGVVFPDTVGNAVNVRMYDMADPEPRVQVWDETIPIVPSASDPLPNEVAICLSFSADPQSGQTQARRRGRLFLGPVAQSCMSVIGSHAYVSLATRLAIVNAADALAAGFEHPASPGLRLHWAIFSPTTLASPGGTLGGSFHDVQSGWVDDAFDIQRRRGADATARTTFIA